MTQVQSHKVIKQLIPVLVAQGLHAADINMRLRQTDSLGDLNRGGS